MGQYTTPRQLTHAQRVYLLTRDDTLIQQTVAGMSPAAIATLPASRTYHTTQLIQLQQARAQLIAAHPQVGQKAGDALFISLHGEPMTAELISIALSKHNR